ncbi:MAG: ribulose phosphate epimerase [Myxococcales bacterium]|nr:ribulose phosphate epimerase [Myxococcales bacterium]
MFGCGTTGTIGGCDIWGQDCPDGEKCTAWADDGGSSWNANKCVPVNPDPKQTGDECVAEGSGVSGLDDCDKGLMCWNTDENNLGYCIEFCMGDMGAPFCSDPNAVCVIVNDGVLPICLPPCDPLLQDCPGSDACLPVGEDFVCVLDASGPDAGADGDPCEFANACDPGLFCANAEFVPGCQAAGCCSSFCNLDEPNMCPLMEQGAECVAFFEMGMAPPGKENLGGCGLPG